MAHRIPLLALGDSYTVGESVPVEQSWPHRLAARLTRAGHPTELTVVATTGWTAADLLAAIEADPPGEGFDLISLSVGVNDQYQGGQLESYLLSLRRLLALTRQMGGAGRPGLFAVSIPDWGVTPFASDRDGAAIGADIDRFNRAFRGAAQAAGVPFVDVTELSRRPGAGVAEDGLHPSGSEYEHWVDEIWPVALGLLGGEV